MNVHEAIQAQAKALWHHIPAELHPPVNVASAAKFDRSGRLLVRYGPRWYSLVGDVAWTWLVDGDNQPAVEVVEYRDGVETRRDLVAIPT